MQKFKKFLGWAALVLVVLASGAVGFYVLPSAEEIADRRMEQVVEECNRMGAGSTPCQHLKNSERQRLKNRSAPQ